MENSCGIIEVRDDEDEIELELGLSLGRNFGKAEKLKPIKKDSNNNLGEIMVFYDQTKKEIQALRRQEAKKKREEKQYKKGTMGVHQNGELESRENDVVYATEERECKKNKVQYFPGNVGSEQNVCPVIPVPLPCPLPPYRQVQFVPLAYSCWNGGGGANEKRVAPSTAVGNCGFRPFRPVQDSSVGSPMCSSSVGSDLQSSSNQGGCSSETITNTSHCQPEKPQTNPSIASNMKGQSEQTSHHIDCAQSVDKSSKGIEKTASIKLTESTPMEEGSKWETQPNLNSKPTMTNETPTAILTKTTKGHMGKPPKPQTPTHEDMLSLRNMPCVSTTGNGPNGKTINGFLFRYTKSEVSIICVCHGRSFTPAEFVQHAGGTDVSHPLRHITMMPSPF